MCTCVKNVEIKGLFGRFDLSVDFAPGINVLTGHNGSLKTTLLWVIANVLRADFDRFAFLNFRSLALSLDQGRSVRLMRLDDRNDVSGETDHIIKVDYDGTTRLLSATEIMHYEPSHSSSTAAAAALSESGKPPQCIAPVVYIPAFRATIEALRTIQRSDQPDDITNLIRYWLLPFAPRVDYPTLTVVERVLSDKKPNWSGSQVESYLEAVNSFLEDKRLVVDLHRKNPRSPAVRVVYGDGSFSRLAALSAGEREIVILMFAAANADVRQVLLFDEPENSLHVAWQRELLNSVAERFGYQQIISCTHSPVISSRHLSQKIERRPSSVDLEAEIPL